MELTKDTVAALTLPEGKSDAIFFDDDLPGFGVRLRAGGKAVWIIQYRVGVQQRRETLGDIRKVDLKAAREEARKRFAKVTLGSDPAAEKEEAAIKARRTLGAIVEQYLTFKADKLKPNSLHETARYLRKSWKPLHGMPIHKIERADVAAVLNRIAAASGGISANRAQSALSALYTWSMREGLTDTSPMIAINKRAPETARDRILDDDELRAVWKASKNLTGPYGALVRFILLTATRRDEAGGMRRDEVTGTDWLVPASRMKGKKGHKRDHLVPLSPAAMAIINDLPALGSYCFTINGKRPFNAFAPYKEELDKRSGVTGWVLHDLRRTARSLMSRAQVNPDHAERCLAHVIGGIRGTYDRYEYRDEKAHAFEKLADMIERVVNPPADNVVPLRKGVSQVPG
jgi:integrase